MSKKLALRILLTGLVIAGVCFCIFRALRPPDKSDYTESLIGEVVEVIGYVKGDPDLAGDSSSMRITDLTINNEEVGGVLYVYGDFGSDIERGDKIALKGKMSEGFGSFIGAVFRPKITEVAKPEPGSLLLKFRNRFTQSVKSVLDEKESQLGLAYLFGMRNGLDDEMLNILSLVGLTHLVVASGTHLGIIVEFFKKRFGKISRFAGLLFSLIFVLGFGQIVGWTASITRAAVVSLISLVGWYYGRKIEAWRIILFAILITLLIEPTNATDLGWQLSFASFIGIMVVEPIITEFFFGRRKPGEKMETWKKRAPGKIAEVVLASVSATIMCAPILLYYFGSISLISIVANVLILPTIPVAMGLTFVTGAVSFLPSFLVFDWLKYVAKTATSLLLDYHIYIMGLFSKQTSFIISIPKENPLVFLMYLPLIVIIVIYCAKKHALRKSMKFKVWSSPKKHLPFGG